MAKKDKNNGVTKKIIDGRPQYSPYDLSTSKKKEIKDKIESTYNKYVKKDGKR